MTIKVEISKCKLKVDGFESDFSFFKKIEKNAYPKPRQAARSVLSILPSPDNSERAFSSAQLDPK